MTNNDEEKNKGLAWWAWILIILSIILVLYGCYLRIKEIKATRGQVGRKVGGVEELFNKPKYSKLR